MQTYNAGINICMAFIVQCHKQESNYVSKRAFAFLGQRNATKTTIMYYCYILDHQFFSHTKINLSMIVDFANNVV